MKDTACPHLNEIISMRGLASFYVNDYLNVLKANILHLRLLVLTSITHSPLSLTETIGWFVSYTDGKLCVAYKLRASDGGTKLS